MRKNAKLNVFVAAILAIAMCLPFMASCSIGFVSDLNVCEVKANGVSVSLEAENGDGEWVSAAGTFLNFKANEGANRIDWKAGSINALPALRVKNKGTDNVKYTLSVKGVNGDEKLGDSLVWTLNGEPLTTEPAQLRADSATDKLIFKAQVKDGTANEGLSLDSAAITLVAEKDDSRYPVEGENEFKTALSEGGEITLGANVDIVPVVKDTTARTLVPQTTVDKDVTLNLNGKKIAPAASAAEADYGEASVLLMNVTGGTLTINGNGVLDCEAGNNQVYGINVNGGKVVVNGGSFYGAMTAIQVQKGALEINGGFFDMSASCKAAVPQYAKYVVNCIDAAFKDGTATLTIKGGTFVNFDPSANPEGPNTSYVAKGYGVEVETKENGDVWYTVVKAENKLPSTVKDLQESLTLDDIPVIEGTDKHYAVTVNMGKTTPADINYSETSTGYTGKGVMLGSTNLNSYAAKPAKAGEYSFIFKNGEITSAATGYSSIDSFKDTSVYMLVPGNSDVTFENMTFNGVFSFDIQLYTSPWSYLNSITFKNCVFNGIIVGSCPAHNAVFEGCTFNNYTNTSYANNSNPIWWRSGVGYWGSGTDQSVHSLDSFTFIGNNVTSTRPVKIERIGWNCTAEITFKNNNFDISAQADDTVTKNMAINIGQKDNTSKFILVDDGNTISNNTASLYTAALGSGSNQYVPVVGNKVLDGAGNEKTITAMVWKTTTGETFEMKTVVNPYADATYSPVVSDAEIASAVSANDKAVVALSKPGTYQLPNLENKELHVVGNRNTVIDMENKINKATELSFSGITVNFGTSDYCGFQHTEKIVYENCKITGKQFLYADSVEFINCEFVQDAVDYNVWTYGAGTVTFKGCTFTCKGKSVLIYNEGHITNQTVNFEDCSFVASEKATDKAAIEIDSSFNVNYVVNIDTKTRDQVTGFDNGSVSGNPVWNNKKGDKATVVVAGETVLAPAA